ncbi:MAG: cation transporter [Cloacibacterium sp.]|nr:cation transporter [Cloacibacterium sp.]
MIHKIQVEKIEKDHCVCAVKRDILKLKEVKSVDVEKAEGLFTIIGSEEIRAEVLKKLEAFGHRELKKEIV